MTNEEYIQQKPTEFTRYHEAGHYLMARRFGVMASPRVYENGDGVCLLDSAIESISPRMRAMVYMAGPAAEAIAMGWDRFDELCDYDYDPDYIDGDIPKVLEHFEFDEIALPTFKLLMSTRDELKAAAANVAIVPTSWV